MSSALSDEADTLAAALADRDEAAPPRASPSPGAGTKRKSGGSTPSPPSAKRVAADGDTKDTAKSPDCLRWRESRAAQAYTWLVLLPLRKGKSTQHFRKVADDLRLKFGLKLTTEDVSKHYQHMSKNKAGRLESEAKAFLRSQFPGETDVKVMVDELFGLAKAECIPSYDAADPAVQSREFELKELTYLVHRTNCLLSLELAMAQAQHDDVKMAIRSLALGLKYQLKADTAAAAAEEVDDETVLEPEPVPAAAGNGAAAAAQPNGYNSGFLSQVNDKKDAKDKENEQLDALTAAAAAAAADRTQPSAAPASAPAAQVPAPAPAPAAASASAAVVQPARAGGPAIERAQKASAARSKAAAAKRRS